MQTGKKMLFVVLLYAIKMNMCALWCSDSPSPTANQSDLSNNRPHLIQHADLAKNPPTGDWLVPTEQDSVIFPLPDSQLDVSQAVE